MLLDIGLRGGAIALLALLAFDALLQMWKTPAGRITFLFDLCGIAFLIETAPTLRDSHSAWLLPLQIASNMASGVFVLWSEELFADSVKPSLIRWLPVYTMALLAIWALTSDTWWAWRITHVMALMIIIFAIGRVVLGRADDLVEPRRRNRIVFALGLGLSITGCTVLGMTNGPMTPALPGVLGIALAAALLRLHRASPAIPAMAAPSTSTTASARSGMTQTEAALYTRLLRAMDVERAYRDGGMTVASLAQRLNTPEYRLRQLINQRLGHRNFASFVNSYRLADARSGLADPDQARVPILTIALDAGFESIGPFNRAFKLNTGETPTEFRKRALAAQL